MRTNVAFTVLALAVLAGGQVSAERSADVEYVGGYHGYGGGYGGHGHHKWGDVEMFLKMRKLLIEAATSAVGFSQLASLNQFNAEVIDFPYAVPGKLSLYVRELEKVPPYYKYNYMHKKPARSVDAVDDEEDMI